VKETITKQRNDFQPGDEVRKSLLSDRREQACNIGSENGVHQLVRISRLMPTADNFRISIVSRIDNIEMKSINRILPGNLWPSGAGGQNVNKVETAGAQAHPGMIDRNTFC
jgi:protein subunit release factor B